MATPRQIGRYRVERLLGTGSFATVWLAYDPGLDGRVALKILAENWSLDDDVKRRFLEEARILWRAQNDRIVRVHLVDQHEGRPFFVMDYADRGTLHERIRDRYGANQRYSVEEAVAMAQEIAACLTVAHDLGIVHRDLKPSNLLFQAAPERRSGAPTERLMLADFGLARRLEATAHQTVIAGTPAYMAPEQGDERLAGRVDERSDIFSANAILYELLAGKPPFTGRSIDSVRDAQRLEQVQALTTVRGDIPDALDAVIRRGLAYHPAERHATAHAWSEALTVALAGADHTVPTAREPTVADPPPAAPPPSETPQPPSPAPSAPKVEPRAERPTETQVEGSSKVLPEPPSEPARPAGQETGVAGSPSVVAEPAGASLPPLAHEPDIEAGGATSVPLPPPSPTATSGARRNPPLAAIVGGVAAVVVIAVVLVFALKGSGSGDGGGSGGGGGDNNHDPKRAALTTAPVATDVTCPTPSTPAPNGGLEVGWLAPDRPGLPGTVRVNPAQSFGDVVIATDKGVVAGFDSITGAETFREQLDGTVRGDPGQGDSVLYYGTTAGSLYKVDPSAAPGSEVSRIYTSDRPLGGVAVDAGVAYVGRTSVDGGLLMIEIATGKQLRVIPTDGPVFGKPNVDEKATKAAYFASAGGVVYRLALPGTGAEEPVTFKVGGRVEAAVRLADNRVVVGTTNGIVEAHDAASGEKIWSRKLEQREASTQPGVFVAPALTNGLAVVAASDCGLHALNLQGDGRTVWTLRSGAPIETSPVVAAGALIMTNAGGCVSAVKPVPDAGAKVGQILATTKPCPEAVPKALYANKNWVRVGTDAGQVLALALPAEGYAR